MSVKLPIRSAEMFGRQRDVRELCTRALTEGVTLVTGRPQMGKTWLLQGVGRTLAYETNLLSDLDASKYLVGYHECLGEDDQFLRVVSDLYTRWLEQADAKQQAKILWEKSRGTWLEKTASGRGSLWWRSLIH